MRNAKGQFVKKHGDSRYKKFRFYRIWMCMRNRCDHQHDIFVCGRWGVYENFKKDMYENYLIHCAIFGEDNTTLDRIDNDGNYTPENCRWATRRTQMSNSNNVKKFVGIRLSDGYREEALLQVSFARKHGLRQGHVSNCLLGRRRVHLGWRFEYV